MLHRVVIFGHDLTLLTTRELILERAGFEVRISEVCDEVDALLLAVPCVDLLILCHTAAVEERSRILSTARTGQENLAVLFLSADSQSPATTDHDEVFRTLDGPYDFLRTVCRLLHEPAPAPYLFSSSNPGKELCHDLQER